MKFYRVFTYTIIFLFVKYQIRFIQCTDTTPNLTGTDQSQSSTTSSGTEAQSKEGKTINGIDVDVSTFSYTDNYIYKTENHTSKFKAKEGYGIKKVKFNSKILWQTTNTSDYAKEVIYHYNEGRVTIKKANDQTEEIKKENGKWPNVVVTDNEVVNNGCGCTCKNFWLGLITLGIYNLYMYCKSK